jgi:hypothetical protein
MSIWYMETSADRVGDWKSEILSPAGSTVVVNNLLSFLPRSLNIILWINSDLLDVGSPEECFFPLERALYKAKQLFLLKDTQTQLFFLNAINSR